MSALTFRNLCRFLASMILLVASTPLGAGAQQGATISGRAVDAADGTALSHATVVVQNAVSGDTLSGAIAARDGRFLIRGVRAGRYTIHTSFVGFHPAQSEVLVSDINPSYDLGDVRLTRMVTIEQIEVTASAIRAAGVGTEVFRLNEGAAPAAGSVLDALKNLPGVTIDQEGRVSLRGSDRVAILIDGRQSSLTGFGAQKGLDNITAANIEAIEIIHNPSASFDAGGMAGIINIIYKHDRRLGWSGDVGLSFGMGEFTRQRADLPTELGSYTTNEKIIPSVNLNHTTKWLRAFLQGEFRRQHRLPNNEFHTRFYDDGRVIESQVPENRYQTHHIVKLGADISLNSANTLTIAAMHDLEHHTDRAQVPFILQPAGVRERFWFWREEESTGLANLSANWKHSFATPGHELRANLQYSLAWEDEQYFLNEQSAVRVGTDMTHLEAKEYAIPLALDYVRPLASGRLEVGSKLQRRWLPITYRVERGERSVIYPGLGDRSDWEENILAAYANLVRIKPNYTLEAGVRMERTEVAYRIPDENIYYPRSDAYDYFELFPNIKLNYSLGTAWSAVAAYNRRIDRPGEPELRIFPKYDDPELLKVGNPYLRPQLTDVLELGIARSWPGGSVRTSAYLRDSDDAFMRILAIDTSNPRYDIVNKIYHNVGHARQSGAEVNIQQQITAVWRISGRVNWYVNEIDPLSSTLLFPTPRPVTIAGSRDDTWDLSINNRYQLPRAAQLQLTYVYYAPRNVPQGWEHARSSLDLAGSMPFFDNRAEVVFTFTDMFNDFGVRRDIAGQGFTALYENLLESQVATMGVRVKF
jgi:outer membrane receptor protein involved in Fe transport